MYNEMFWETPNYPEQLSQDTESEGPTPIQIHSLSGRGRGEQTGLYKHSFIWCSPFTPTEII